MDDPARYVACALLIVPVREVYARTAAAKADGWGETQTAGGCTSVGWRTETSTMSSINCLVDPSMAQTGLIEPGSQPYSPASSSTSVDTQGTVSDDGASGVSQGSINHGNCGGS